LEDHPKLDSRLEAEVNLLHAHVCQALADPKRILILYALADEPRYVSELAEFLDTPQSTVSRHLKVLRDQSLVTAERSGSSVRYSLNDHRVIDALDLLRGLLMGSLEQQAQLAQVLAAPAGTADIPRETPTAR
jgi:DNA-binding transcriptional ArsR family regulator